ncbi:stage V sporulation protein B [Butyrivibrio sp. YAB3001]|nr:stage V sporulation protein B [Butyrivibrio sp. YAB3001]
MQAGILAMAGMISRVIGLLYGSPLAAIIGDEGNGYYGAAYQIYTIVLFISSYSIPSAMSKIISQKLAVKEYRNAHRIFHCALIYVTIVGLLGSLLLFLGANVLVAGRSATVLRFFAPTIFLFGFLGVLRGYFQAHRTMIPTSISQLLEQIINAIVSVTGAYILTGIAGNEDPSKRAVYGAIGSALGTGSGVLIALLFMLLVYYANKKNITRRVQNDTHDIMPDKEIFKLIILIVTPFIISSSIYNLSSFLNWTLFSRILIYVKKMEESTVVAMYGIFTRKAMVITNLPISLASAAAAAMIPEISILFAKGDKEGTSETVSKVVKVILLIAIPCAAGLLFLAKPIIMILFPQRVSIDEAALLLRILSVTVVFYSLSTLTNAVLQGIGRVHVPVVNAVIALVIQTIVLSGLLLFTNITDEALCIVTIVYSAMMCVLNAYSLRKNIKTDTDYKTIVILPALSALVMGVFAYLSYVVVTFLFYIVSRLNAALIEISFKDYMYSSYFVNLVASMISIILAVVVYFTVLIKTGGATEEDIKRLPKGTSLANLLKKIKIL